MPLREGLKRTYVWIEEQVHRWQAEEARKQVVEAST